METTGIKVNNLVLALYLVGFCLIYLILSVFTFVMWHSSCKNEKFNLGHYKLLLCPFAHLKKTIDLF